MCRSIKPLFHLDPSATPDEIRAASRQFVRKISGFQQPSQKNEAAYDQAIAEITQIVTVMLHSLKTNAPVRIRR